MLASATRADKTVAPAHTKPKPCHLAVQFCQACKHNAATKELAMKRPSLREAAGLEPSYRSITTEAFARENAKSVPAEMVSANTSKSTQVDHCHHEARDAHAHCEFAYFVSPKKHPGQQSILCH